MPLSPEERAELASLRDEFSTTRAGGLSPQERAELDSLRAEFPSPMPPRQRTGSGVIPMDVSGMGVGERIARGAVGGLEDIGLGATQIANLGSDETIAARLRREARDIAERKAPLYETVAGTVGQVLPALALPGATLPRAIASGAAYGAVQPETEEGGRGEEAALGALGFGAGNLAGQAVGKGVARLISPLRGGAPRTAVQAARDDVVREAEELGLKVSAGARTGNRVVQGMESVMARAPITGGRAQRFGEENLARANQVLAKEFGSQDQVLTKQVFAEASQRIGQEFNALMSPGRKIAYDGRFMSALKNVKDEISLLPPRTQKRLNRVKATIADLYDDVLPVWRRGNVSIDSKRYQLLRSELADDVRELARKRPKAAAKVDRIIKALDDMAGRSLPGEQQAAFKAARKQWQGLRLAEDAVDKYGNVTIPKLDASIARHKPRAAKGQDVHRALSRSLGVIGDKIPNSGTPERLLAMGGLLGMGGLVGTGTIEPETAAQLAAILAGSRGVQELFLRQGSSRALSNSLAGRMRDLPGAETVLRNSLRASGAGGYGTLLQLSE